MAAPETITPEMVAAELVSLEMVAPELLAVPPPLVGEGGCGNEEHGAREGGECDFFQKHDRLLWWLGPALAITPARNHGCPERELRV
jgi:hypothetical protein